MLRSKSICKVFETNPVPQSPCSTDTLRSTPWFDYVVRVSPHHTDYGGIVWHGTYISWMEEARVERLRLAGLEYHTLVEMGCELPVIDGQTGKIMRRLPPILQTSLAQMLGTSTL
ncbi:hypothetical protein L2E81_10030 [Planktothrix agardhii 1033]|nr:hypothetical protein [Planktothrix agardhii 1033]